MKTVLLTLAFVGLAWVDGVSQIVDKSKPSGRACVGIVNVANGDEEALRASSVAGRNQKIVAHLDATAKCEALVVPFLKSGPLVPGWLPQYADVSPGREMVFPKAPTVWSWEKETGPLEIYVLFLTLGSKAGVEIRALVNAMQRSGDGGIAKLQAGKLRELIGRANIDKAAAQRAPKANPEVAGVMRMVVGFEWRDSARATNFSSEKPGALIFPATDSR